MGLFGFGKKKPEPQKAPASNTSEFDAMVRELMARSDIQDRTDICREIYNRAMKLIENPTQQTVMRAYDLMGNLASQFSFVPAMLWMGDFAESVRQMPDKACYWYKKAADLGSGDAARNYADMLMAGKGTARNPQDALRYYELAMNQGVPEAALVMGEFYRSAGDKAAALAAYRKALEGGYSPAKTRIEQLENG